MSMTPIDLAAIGQAAYGPNWVSALAADSGVTEPTLRKYRDAGAIPPKYLPRIAQGLRARGEVLQRLADQVEEAQ